MGVDERASRRCKILEQLHRTRSQNPRELCLEERGVAPAVRRTVEQRVNVSEHLLGRSGGDRVTSGDNTSEEIAHHRRGEIRDSPVLTTADPTVQVKRKGR